MPKTKKKFDWEIYDEHNDFIDILSMTREESKKYKERFPDHILLELGYTEE